MLETLAIWIYAVNMVGQRTQDAYLELSSLLGFPGLAFCDLSLFLSFPLLFFGLAHGIAAAIVFIHAAFKSSGKQIECASALGTVAREVFVVLAASFALVLLFHQNQSKNKQDEQNAHEDFRRAP